MPTTGQSPAAGQPSPATGDPAARPRPLPSDGRPPALVIQHVRTGDRVRRMAVLRRPVRTATLVVGALALLLAIVVGAGRGGGQDGAVGAAIAVVVLIGGTVLIQRLSAGRRLLLGFNPDGLWAPTEGWVEWGQVRHLEVRQTQSLLAGRRHTVWLGFQPPEGEERWLAADPGYRRARTVALLEEMERCWKAAGRPPPSQEPR